MPDPLPVPDGLTTRTTYADPTIHSVYTEGAWAIWYHPDFFTLEDAQTTAEYLVEARAEAVTNTGTPDAKPLAEGHYVNVLLHHLPNPSIDDTREDGFPDFFGNGVGTDNFENPFITFPKGAEQARANVYHEAFHIFQYTATAPGFAYAGDSQWYIETTAEWFAWPSDPDNIQRYITSGSIAGNPHLALWHSFGNGREEDPIHWMLEARQYGLHLFADYLDAVTPITGDDLISGFFTDTTMLPQEYLTTRIGKDVMADAFADMAALVTASFAVDAPMPDWVMSEAQRDYAREERQALIDLDPIDGIVNDYAFSLDLGSEYFSGVLAPPAAQATRAWAYNAIPLGTPEGELTVSLLGGNSEGFEMRLAHLSESGWTFTEVTSGTAQTLSGTSQAFLIIASVPDVYSGNDDVPYAIEIALGENPVTGEQVTGTDAANLLSGTTGDDIFDGGLGDDVVAATGTQASYTLTLSEDGATLADRRAGGDGTDTLNNVESIAFGQGGDSSIFDLSQFGGAQGLSEADMMRFIELYIAYFDRAPDAVGLNFWGTAFATGTSLSEMAALFVDQDETRALYPEGATDEDFASAVYNNVLGRLPDADGFAFWVGVLEDGSVSRDQFILAVLEGAKAAPPDGADDAFILQQTADQEFLANKADIGAYFAVTKGLSDVTQAGTVMEMFDGTDSTKDAARMAIDSYHAYALDGQTGAFLMPLVGVISDPFAPSAEAVV